MEKNKQILSEMFFKKAKYADKLKNKLPQYTPQDTGVAGKPGFGSIMMKDGSYAVTDKKEAVKRLTGFLGSQMATTTVKSLASRSIKSFPIVISDNVEPETSVLLKRVMEEQYAEYINLLISNQLIDLSAFRTGEDEGNIAIQAIKGVTGAPRRSAAAGAMQGDLDPGDFLGNLPLYNLIRREEKEYKTGMPLFDTLLEGALIVPSENEKELIEFMNENMNEIVMLGEASPYDEERISSAARSDYVTLDDIAQDMKSGANYTGIASSIRNREGAMNALKGLELPDETTEIRRLRTVITQREATRNQQRSSLATLVGIPTPTPAQQAQITQVQQNIQDLDNEIQSYRSELVAAENRAAMPGTYRKLSTPSILIKPHELERSLDHSIGEMLYKKGNESIRDRFEKATFLLQSNRIAGSEYIDYLVQRLGIPVPKGVRGQIVSDYRTSDIRNLENPGGTGNHGLISDVDAHFIMNNQLLRQNDRWLNSLLSISGKYILTGLAAATTGAGILGMALAGTILTPFLAPTIVGGLGLVAAIKAIRGRKRFAANRASQIQGWERVESLIVAMEAQQADVRRSSERDTQEPVDFALMSTLNKNDLNALKNKDENSLSGEELSQLLNIYSSRMEKTYKNIKPSRNESYNNFEFTLGEAAIKDINRTSSLVINEMYNDEEFVSSQLSEAVVSTTVPVTLTKKYEYDTRKKPDVLATPTFSARSQYAYGSVEYDKRELKDRRYNTPLMMTVKFKERFSDGTFADNELTAVIGILGVINRIPSEEMEYILKANLEGTTLKGILKSDGKSVNDIAMTLLNAPKIKKDIEKLQTSIDVWRNLENVAKLAAANKLAGKSTNNIANAHIIFSQKEIDNVRSDSGTDYLRDKKLVAQLMKRYSAFTIMVANDVAQRVYVYDQPEKPSWEVVPYSAFMNKDTGEQLNAMLKRMSMGSGRM